MALLNINLGKSVFRALSDYTDENDIFAYGAGSAAFFPKIPSVVIDSGSDTIASPENAVPKPEFNKVLTSDQIPLNTNEYGYGFWFRYLTRYPFIQWAGKNQAWYVVSRLTSNEKNDNAGFGDRVLAIWQGQGYYHYTTCNAADGNPNFTANINYPEDIEGLWAYVYYSHGRQAKRSVGFIKFGDAAPQRIQHDVTHPAFLFLRFVLGKDAWYPAFNGVFRNVIFRIQGGSFIDSLE
jgi:hypothetical protein